MRVVINGATMAAFLKTDPTMQKALGVEAAKLEQRARDLAPVGTSIRWGPIKTKSGGVTYSARHGYFKAHFTVRPFRGAFRVGNDDPFAHLVEWGSVHNRAYAPLRRAVRSSGLRYVPNPQSRGA